MTVPGSDRPSSRLALITYSTKSRGGVVHTLNLAEALYKLGQSLHLFGMGNPDDGFFRPTMVPHTIIPAPPTEPTLEQRVFSMVDTMSAFLTRHVPGRYDIMHTQDCIAARAATRVRDAGAPVVHLRTVHHVDDFTTPALIECQNRSILDPDRLLVVSQYWRRLLHEEYGVDPFVITNGVDTERFTRPRDFNGTSLRAGIGAAARFLFLHVGGIEPRKGSLTLVEALSRLRSRVARPPIVLVIGSKPFQDFSGYRDEVFARARELDVEVGRDLILMEGVGDAELPLWYFASDAFVFPSLKEGWGLAVLEALAAGLPVVTSDIPVFKEYLVDGQDVLMAAAGDPEALAGAMARVMTDSELRARLSAAGRQRASRFTWDACARQHIEIYRRVAKVGTSPAVRTI